MNGPDRVLFTLERLAIHFQRNGEAQSASKLIEEPLIDIKNCLRNSSIDLAASESHFQQR
jgi:hypothetical protein